jgi:predicted glycogen debranching enzyme
LVAKLDATVAYRGVRYDLSTNEYADGTLAPSGTERLVSFELDAHTPVWVFQCADALIEQRIEMQQGANLTRVAFRVRHASAPVDLEIVPLCAYRDYHSHMQGGWSLEIESHERGVRISAFAGARPYQLAIDQGTFVPDPTWYWRFKHRVEAERGLDTHEDLFRPGVFRATLASGSTATIIAWAEEVAAATDQSVPTLQGATSVRASAAAATQDPEWIATLRRAATQFIVARADANGRLAGTTVIAGYPWFTDWGRDTMIALPGLTLTTGREADAVETLRTFARHVSEGMLPNRFPDGGEAPEYNTVDATLWMFHALDCHLRVTRDQALLRELLPVLADVVKWHDRGTRFGISVDGEDGLLRAGQAGLQLTWMDAKVGDWVVTPRIGKPVEINALWHFAHDALARWSRWVGDDVAANAYARGAHRIRVAFNQRFWNPDAGCLYDVIDGPDGGRDAHGRHVDGRVRPNQLFAVSLGANLLDPEVARAVVDTCAKELLTPVGLRSLSPRDPEYRPRYEGGPWQRDGAYHQGTVWSWLLGPFALAHYHTYDDAEQALAIISAIAPHIAEGCVGTISEIFDAEAPHVPRGCFAQAWSVAEVLRAYDTLRRAALSDVCRPTAGRRSSTGRPPNNITDQKVQHG